MAKTHEQLEKEYYQLLELANEQNSMLDSLIDQKSTKLKKGSRQYFKENEKKELFLKNKGLMEEYKEFKNQISRDSKKSNQ